MTDTQITFNPNFSVEPELKSALDRLLDTTKQSITEFNVLENAINPWQSFLQTSAHTATFLNNLNWLELVEKPQEPEVYKKVFTEFTDLQEAAAKRFSDDQKELFDTIVKDGKSFIGTTELSDPQATAANIINKSLDTLEDVKENLSNQMQTAVSIQAAFVNWYQQSLATLTKH